MSTRNIFIGSGVVDKWKEGLTSSGETVCSFTLNMTDRGFKSWIRCNAYEMLADYCRNELCEGDSVFVEGRVMNRRTKDKLLAFTEVRCLNVQLLQKANKE